MTGQLYIESVDPADVVAEFPGAGKQRGEEVTLDRSNRKPLEPGRYLSVCHVPGALQASERRKHFSVKVRRGVKLVSA